MKKCVQVIVPVLAVLMGFFMFGCGGGGGGNGAPAVPTVYTIFEGTVHESTIGLALDKDNFKLLAAFGRNDGVTPKLVVCRGSTTETGGVTFDLTPKKRTLNYAAMANFRS